MILLYYLMSMCGLCTLLIFIIHTAYSRLFNQTPGHTADIRGQAWTQYVKIAKMRRLQMKLTKHRALEFQTSFTLFQVL